MPVTIGSNIASLRAQRQLGISTDKLSTTFERLSSGQRINTASDDAAGLAISESLEVSARVYSQGIRNLSDGVSLLTIADGAVAQLSDIITRQSELAEQAANGTYSGKQRVALQSESNALVNEYNRIIDSTAFNGIKILDGTSNSIRFQGGLGLTESTAVSTTSSLGGLAGDGTFSLVQSSGAQIPASGAEVATDLNRDGKIDVVSVGGPSSGLGGINLNFNNGDGTFSFSTRLDGSTIYFGVAVGDFNNDGITDIAAGTASDQTVRIFQRRADGTYLIAQTLNVSSSIYSNISEARDFNGDGYLDFLVDRGSSDQITLLQGSSSGSFSTHVINPTDPLQSIQGVAISDVTGDGNLDVIGFDQASGLLKVLAGNGDGTFKYVPTGIVRSGAHSVTTGDFNNDGKADLTLKSGSELEVLLGNGNGTFTQSISIGVTGFNGATAQVAEVNGDGLQDLVYSDGSGTIYTAFGKGDGTFSKTISTPGLTSPFLLKDLNGDGAADIFGPGGFTTYIYFGNVDGTGRRNTHIEKFNLLTIPDARSSLTTLSQLRDLLAKQRGDIGSALSRISYATANLTTRSLNYESARSRIMDADVAQESANLVRNQILQKTASSILAQANLQPQIALQLLQ